MAEVNQQFGVFGSTCTRRNPITSFLTSSNLGEGYIVSCPILPIYSPSSACLYYTNHHEIDDTFIKVTY